MIVLLGCALAGAVLALVWLAGLWATVRRLPDAAHPVRLVVLSLIVRLVVVVGGLVVLTVGPRSTLLTAGQGLAPFAAGEASRLLAALAGMLVVRGVVLHRRHRPGTGVAGPAAAPGGRP